MFPAFSFVQRVGSRRTSRGRWMVLTVSLSDVGFSASAVGRQYASDVASQCNLFK